MWSSVIEGPDDRTWCVGPRREEARSLVAGLVDIGGAPLADDNSVQTVLIYYIQWSLITRSVRGPAGAAVWQCLCRGRP